MNEHYYNIKVGENKEQYGVVFRVREGKLEELTGFFTLKEIGKTSQEICYETNVKVNGHGENLGEEDLLGLMLYQDRFPQVEIFKQPKSKEHQSTISEITMSRAAKILEDIEYIRDAEAYIQ